MRKYEAIRTEIKKLSAEQKEFKPMRKQSYTPRTMGQEQTQYLVINNKYELRHLFQAYAILKNIPRPLVTKPSNYNGILIDEKKVQDMVNKFRPLVVEEV